MNEGDLEHIRAVKHRHEAELMRKPNVVGVGIGGRWDIGQPVTDLGIVVNVTHKVPEDALAPEDRIPEQVEDVPVRVHEVGEIQAQTPSAGGAVSAGRERKSRHPWAFWKRWGAGSKIEEGLDLAADVVESLVERKDSKSSNVSDEEE
ncbi:MAG: hypothetical protein ACLFTI_13920 [Anaerolineales bacterium]